MELGGERGDQDTGEMGNLISISVDLANKRTVPQVLEASATESISNVLQKVKTVKTKKVAPVKKLDLSSVLSPDFGMDSKSTIQKKVPLKKSLSKVNELYVK